MKRRTRQGAAAFLITGIVMIALCGFLAVDLSTDRYMPGQFVPMFEISEVNENGMRVALFGVRYRVEPARLDFVKELACRYRALLPDSVQAAAHLTARGYAAVTGYLEEARPPEEPW